MAWNTKLDNPVLADSALFGIATHGSIGGSITEQFLTVVTHVLRELETRPALDNLYSIASSAEWTSLASNLA